ncbi:MAG: 2,3-bisphosphoglycerate-independent phosphoglycerate mutase [Sphingomonadales bacterium]
MLKKPDHKPKPVVLCILDGWGHAEPGPTNAIFKAITPTYDKWWQTCPRSFLKTSGAAVGLPDGQMGNSEVGHMNIGGGRVVEQDLPRIDTAIKDGSFDKLPALLGTIELLKENGGTLHVMGLMSPGGVHSHQDHIAALARLFSGASIPVKIHAFLDGRDVPPKSALDFIQNFEKPFSDDPNVKIVTVSGRYYAMDRDNRWDRVKKAYLAISEAQGNSEDSATSCIEAAYGSSETDEFVTPTVIGDYSGMKDGDALLMANFRADRAREILTSLVDPGFEGFERPRTLNFSAILGMVEYSENLNQFMDALFDPVEVKESLGEVVSNAGLRQLRIAETEKYAHITFFFNGGSEAMFEGEERILIPSPKVATYDLKPEMSAPELTETLEKEILDGGFDLIVVNFANPDMVGHTGIIEAAIKAVETIDTCLGKLEVALNEVGGVMLVSADHGNIEQMFDPNSEGPHTAHTTFEVPVLFVDPTSSQKIKGLKRGKLADLAPSILDLLGLPKPEAMTGNSLFIRNGEG